jgi:hypothetical protein
MRLLSKFYFTVISFCSRISLRPTSLLQLSFAINQKLSLGEFNFTGKIIITVSISPSRNLKYALVLILELLIHPFDFLLNY